MSNNIEVNYHTTGKSTVTNKLGMRQMQERVYTKRNSKYLLVKAPPASGKSRALMFVALDKLANQGIKKVIVAVPERSIGSSFKNTELVKYGFYEDWIIDPYYDLTSAGTSDSKVQRLIKFMEDTETKVAICTHSTLRNAYQKIDSDKKFDNTLIAIDEFHHVSAEDNSVLGGALKNIMHNSNAHILAMTGSYFRGDSAPILTEEDEREFDKVNYSYYEQLDGYKYLKSFGIDYKFYQGRYIDAIEEAMDLNKKMIIHIPNVNSAESTKDKYDEVDHIFDAIGEIEKKDEETGIYFVRRKTDRKLLKVADLVNEDGREKIQATLRKIKDVDDLDIIIALGMAKEGFDWPWAEYALTIGYRGSLTEIVQIIGRVTRDSENKTHSQFVNLIAQPDADNEDVTYAVNTIIKAITASLLMEQVLSPEIKLKSKGSKIDTTDKNNDDVVFIKGLKEPPTQKAKDIIENDLPDLKAAILQDRQVQQAIATQEDTEYVNKVLIPKVIMQQELELDDEELESVRQHLVADMVVSQSQNKTSKGENGDNKKFLSMANRLVDVEKLDINMIDKINPFQRAYEIMSTNINSSTLRILQREIDSKKYDFSEDELRIIYPQILKFISENNGKLPDKGSDDEMERKYAYALIKLKTMKEEKERLENA